MALRGRVPDAESTYEDPVYGVNLHASEEDLQAGESSQMKNLVHFGGLVSRNGNTALNSSAIASSYAVQGGHKYYYGGASPAKLRVIAYDTKVSSVNDSGTEGVLNSTYTHTAATSNKLTHFYTWPITDSLYIVNGTDDPFKYDGTDYLPLGAINIRNGTYKWTASGSGTAEYYCELLAGGDPSLLDPTTRGGVILNGSASTNGTMGSLSAGEWDYGDNDTLGYSTIYVRLSDGTDPDGKASGYVQAYQGTNTPGVSTNPVGKQILGLVDRLFMITTNGIERSDPRSDSIWSLNSSWATFRPSQSGSQFKAMIPHVVSNAEGQPQNGALAITESAYYFFTGTTFGDDVTAATPDFDTFGNSSDNGAIVYIDQIGCYGPRGVTSVPGIGTFWITTTANVFFVPAGRTVGRMVGTRIVNTGGSSTTGLESLQTTTANEAWVIYREPYLMIGFTPNSGTYNTTQYWMDMNKFRENPNVPIWYGPMTGQSISCVWNENQQGDNGLYGGEANSSTGIFVYNLRADSVYQDKVGTTATDITYVYSTYLKSGGAPSREKYVQSVEVEMNTVSGQPTVDIADISGAILTGVKLERTFV